MRTKSTALAGLVLLIGALFAGAGAPANAAPAAKVTAAASLWHCRIPYANPPYYTDEVCTRITSAPASGVRVLDRTTGQNVTLYNGNSVFLNWWWVDSSGQCGINGDPYVWQIWWADRSGRRHHGYIGDWYLATGGVGTWKPFPRPGGGTLDDIGGVGSWTGPCNRIL
ncbi:hypothetical protein [Jiangella muralis]|uniref:hypothetical protein n=1 Tax=Jiangella muralis TaxID=702383 RepID=UPI00069E72F0|nr:hypothetical protein [Jiangella muralis]